jgi:hypothetical protein
MNHESLMGMTFGVLLGLSGGILAGWLQHSEHQRREAALRTELDTVVGDLNALRVEAEWDRFEQDRMTAPWQGGAR